VSKNSGLLKDKKAPDIFLKKIFEFKRRRRFHRWIQVNPLVLRGKSKDSFNAIVDTLEDFRCSLGLGTNVFYKILSEFILITSGRKYYPFRMIFSSEENQVSEEFITRIVDILPWIVEWTGHDFENDSEVKNITEFSNRLLEKKIDVRSAAYKSKDWYCICAIKAMAEKRGWNENKMLEMIGKFYKRRLKKVTSEMVLADLVHGELDRMEMNEKEKELEREEKATEKEKVKKEKQKAKKELTVEDLIYQQNWLDR
jgi:hypothetical protein